MSENNNLEIEVALYVVKFRQYDEIEDSYWYRPHPVCANFKAKWIAATHLFIHSGGLQFAGGVQACMTWINIYGHSPFNGNGNVVLPSPATVVHNLPLWNCVRNLYMMMIMWSLNIFGSCENSIAKIAPELQTSVTQVKLVEVPQRAFKAYSRQESMWFSSAICYNEVCILLRILLHVSCIWNSSSS